MYAFHFSPRFFFELTCRKKKKVVQTVALLQVLNLLNDLPFNFKGRMLI